VEATHTHKSQPASRYLLKQNRCAYANKIVALLIELGSAFT